MMPNTTVLVGNLTREPELRYTSSGKAFATIGVAHNRRFRKGDDWEEQTSFFNVVCWGDMAENVASSLVKGARVVIVGRLEQRSWETDTGDKRSVVEIVADDVAASLAFATAEVSRTARQETSAAQGASQAGRRPSPQAAANYDEEPF